jgi:hypothetical protein
LGLRTGGQCIHLAREFVELGAELLEFDGYLLLPCYHTFSHAACLEGITSDFTYDKRDCGNRNSHPQWQNRAREKVARMHTALLFLGRAIRLYESVSGSFPINCKIIAALPASGNRGRKATVTIFASTLLRKAIYGARKDPIESTGRDFPK